jgi:hypothetical protein
LTARPDNGRSFVMCHLWLTVFGVLVLFTLLLLLVTLNSKLESARLEAVRTLGWTSLPVQFVDDLDPTELLLLELEENTKRLDITWQENCAAVHKYHELRLAKDPAWTAARTAEALGESVKRSVRS